MEAAGSAVPANSGFITPRQQREILEQATTLLERSLHLARPEHIIAEMKDRLQQRRQITALPRRAKIFTGQPTRSSGTR